MRERGGCVGVPPADTPLPSLPPSLVPLFPSLLLDSSLKLCPCIFASPTHNLLCSPSFPPPLCSLTHTPTCTPAIAPPPPRTVTCNCNYAAPATPPALPSSPISSRVPPSHPRILHHWSACSLSSSPSTSHTPSFCFFLFPSFLPSFLHERKGETGRDTPPPPNFLPPPFLSLCATCNSSTIALQHATLSPPRVCFPRSPG